MRLERENLHTLVTIAIIAFLAGSAFTSSIKDIRTRSSTQNTKAGLFDWLFPRPRQDVITENIDLMRLILDHIDRISELETRIAILEECGKDCTMEFPKPDYDSGWHPIDPGQHLTLQHNLNTMEYLVYVIKNEASPTEFHNFGTGGAFIEDYMTDIKISAGTRWNAARNSITVHRYPDDSVSNYVRVMLWKIPQ